MTGPAPPADRASPAPRCGLVAIVGRPNVGKSTLLNALVGQKVSITSRKAQTTRHRITGIRTLGESQFVFVDTPGFQTQHGAALNRTLNRTVKGVLADVDVVLFVVEAGRFTLDDAKVLALMPAPGKGARPVILVANKLDAVRRRAEMAPWLRGMQERYPFAEFVPLSARKAADAQRLLAIVAPYLPAQAWLHEEEALTDRSERFLASELIREKLFRLTGDELPYTSTVVIDRFEEVGEDEDPQGPAMQGPAPGGRAGASGGRARADDGPQGLAMQGPAPEGRAGASGGRARGDDDPQGLAMQGPAPGERAGASGGRARADDGPQGLAMQGPAPEGRAGASGGRARPLRRIAATIIVEREAHKGIVIGVGGERLKRIGAQARADLEALLGARVFLELWVKVRSGWADDEAHLRSYGYE